MTKPVTPAMKVNCLLWLCAINCPECHQPVLPEQRIEWDHRHCVALAGPHEYQNLRPVHYDCHKKKSARDVKAIAKAKRLANPKPSKRPMKSSGRKMPSRPFPKRAKP